MPTESPFWIDPDESVNATATNVAEGALVVQRPPTILDQLDPEELEGLSEEDIASFVEAMTPRTDAEWATHSLIYFIDKYLPRHTTDRNAFAPTHYDLARLLQDPTTGKRVLWLYPREHAKCQSGDAMVQLTDGSRRKLKYIKPGDTVVGIDGLRLTGRKVLWAGATGRKAMLKVTTESGSILKVSHVHRLRTFDGWKEASNLEVGDYLASPRFLIPPSEPKEIPNAEVALLAYWIAEGCRQAGVNLTFSNHDPVVLADIQAWASELGVSSRQIKNPSRYPDGRSVGVRLHSGGTCIVSKHGLDPKTCGAHDKFVPEIIQQLSNQQVALFLNRLFECDGCTHIIRGKPVVSYTSVSRRLVEDIRALLLRFGVISRISYGVTEDKPYWTLLLYSSDAIERFRRHIGFFTKQIKDHNGVRDQARHDLIPPQWRRLRRPGAGDTRKHGVRIDNKYATTREKVLKVAEIDKDPSLKELATSDVWWDKVKSVEVIEDEETYDITVEGVENYIADNVVSHNTTIITFCYVLWCICCNKKRNIVIVSDSRDQAKEFLRNIKTELETNEDIIKDFGWLVGDKKNRGKWDEQHIITSNQVQVKVISTKTTVRGLVFNYIYEVWDEQQQRKIVVTENIRPDLAICDDILNDKYIKNKKVRDQTEDWFFSPFMNALDSEKGDMLVVGTVLHSDDLMSRIYKDEERTHSWIKRKTPACEIDKDGNFTSILWPDRWPEIKLKKRRQEVGSLAFSKEFLLKAIDELAVYFNMEWLRFYIDPRVPIQIGAELLNQGYGGLPSDLVCVTAIDPNNKDKDQADYCVVLTLGYSPTTRNYYVLQVNRDRPSPKQQVMYMINQAKTWDRELREDGYGFTHLGFVIESYAYQTSIKFWLKQFCESEGVFNLRYYQREENADKTLRASIVSPMVEEGRLHLPLSIATDPVTNKLFVNRPLQWMADEMHEFPQGSYDDSVDALQRAYSVLIREERRYTLQGMYGPLAIEQMRQLEKSIPMLRQYFVNPAA